MTVLDYVTHKEIATELNITPKSCYRVKYDTPKRYLDTARLVIIHRVSDVDLVKAVNLICDIKGEPTLTPTVKKSRL